MEQKTLEYIDRYNHQIRLKGLNFKTPKQVLIYSKITLMPTVTLNTFVKNKIKRNYSVTALT